MAQLTPCNLVELLRWRASEVPDQEAYLFLADGGEEEVSITYSELDREARSIGAALQAAGAAGERVLLLYPPSLSYICAFLGCLYAGAVAVPAYPPRRNRNIHRLLAIFADAKASLALTTDSILAAVRPRVEQVEALKDVRWLTTPIGDGACADDWRQDTIQGETLAFLQYTSGSTSAPKGVMVSHANLLYNERMIQQAYGHSSETVFVGWLPLYHDMGLIGNVLQPLFLAIPSILMSPFAFLQKPLRWLQAISRYRATTSGAPDFAYGLCTERISAEERSKLDLSSWNVAFNGAEPVRSATLEKFAVTFAECGFRREAFCPCYGLAEATLLASGGPRDDPPTIYTVSGNALGRDEIIATETSATDARALVGCGSTWLAQEIAIVDPRTKRRSPPQRVGEIWLTGPNVAGGYWQRAEETKRTFGARLAESGEGPFLRTGDLGFLHDGELFVTGRLKDLIIIRGVNHYPQDIEQTAERSHQGLAPGANAAFSVEIQGEERLVLVQEIRRDYRQRNIEEVARAIRQAVSEEHDVLVHTVVLIRFASIAKTSSGKIQRHANRAAFLAGEFKEIGRSVFDQVPTRASTDSAAPPVSEGIGAGEGSFVLRALRAMPTDAQRHALLQVYLQEQIAQALRLPVARIEPGLPLAALGIDSLMAIELRNHLELGLGVVLPMASFLDSPTLDEITAEVLAELDAPSSALALTATPEDGERQPLSYGQRALWFLHQTEPESPAYNVAAAVVVETALDRASLRRAFAALIERHPALRTRFDASRGEAWQQVVATVETPVVEEDAREWDTARLDQRLAEEVRRPFDLTRPPLLRIHLFDRSASESVPSQRTVMLWVMHHIVTDFWSLAILLEELGELYAASQSGRRLDLPALAVRYSDFVRWEEARLAGEDGERGWSYWREHLAGELPLLDLPLDRPRPAVRTFRGASLSRILGNGLGERLKALGRERGATLYMVLLAAFQILLHRHTGQRDLLVGTATAGRDRADLAGLVGYFVNLLALRGEVNGRSKLSDFLAATRRRLVAAFEHQDYPFALLVERLQPARDPSRSPLFQVVFVLQKTQLRGHQDLAAMALGEQQARLRLGGLELSPQPLREQVAQFDLRLWAAESDGSLATSWQYNSDLFDTTTVERMTGHFATLLDAIIEHPQRRLADLALLSDGERRQLLAAPRRRYEVAENICLHHLFEQQVERTPEAVAVSFEDRRLTYHELNRRANRLAHHLIALGVGPEVRTGLCLEPSDQLVVALLAILKAGGAYVPLDPAYPPRRLAFVLEDARVPVLVTAGRLLHQLSERGLATPRASLVRLDQDGEAIGRRSDVNPGPRATSANAVYVIFTSGSTGRPKGVVVAQRQVVRLFSATRDAYAFAADDVWSMLHSFAFDFSVWELWGALLYGGRLTVPPYWSIRTPETLHQLLERERVTVLCQTPSAFRTLVQVDQIRADETSGRLALRWVIFGGEALEFRSLRPWFARHGDRAPTLVNMYGITETAVHTTFRALSRADGERVESRIGSALADLQTPVLDSCMQPVPVGVGGELYVGGDGLARGYLDRPALTAERFIANPHHDAPGERLYRSGDLVRHTGDGDLEYLGRADQQVKIRGFRIELGEIQSVAEEHPEIVRSVVIAGDDAMGGKRLVAYLVSRSEAPSADALRDHLRGQLPDYMVPAVFVFLDALPLTPSGKVDRRALPEPELARAETESVYVAPTDEIEARLVEIWSQVLGVERVGIEDNFFALGGDSILSIQVVARAAEAGLHFTPRQAFEQQTIAALAAVLDHQQKPSADQGTVVGEVPLTSIQAWFFSQRLTSAQHWNQALMLAPSRDLAATLRPAVLASAAEALLRHHDALRSHFERRESSWHQSIAETVADTGAAWIDLTALAAAHQDAVLTAAARQVQASLDLKTGPLMRLVGFDRGAGRGQRLLAVIHHLAVDGVSWRILLADLATACQHLSRGAAARLPAKTTSYRRWAGHLRELAVGPALAAELERWLDGPWEDVSSLPLDIATSPGDTGSGSNVEASARTVSCTLDADETRALLQDVPRAYRTQINDVLLTALVRALGEWTSSGVVLIDLEGHGREMPGDDIDLSRTVGWFTSLFPVLLAVDPSIDTGDALKAVKEQLRQVPGRGMGYGVLRYLRGGEAAEKLAQCPQAEVSFNYLGQLDQVLGEDTPFALALENPGAMRGPRAERRYLLDVLASVVDGGLRIDWTYSAHRHRRETIERLAERFGALLRSLIDHCLKPTAGGYTPSDFPLIRLDPRQLDGVLAGARGVADLYPLAPMQQGLLFHSLYETELHEYVVQVVCRLRGALDEALLVDAWQRVVDRHTVLRTALRWQDLDEPLQVVFDQVEVSWRRQDWRQLPATDQEHRREALLADDRQRDYQLLQAPLLRLILLRLGDEEHELVWSFHHVILDGWSVATVLKEVLAIYQAASRGQAPRLERAYPYRDYVAWLRAEDLAAAESYWRDLLRGFGAPTPLGIVAERSGEADSPPDYGEQRRRLSATATAGIVELARREHLTPSTLVQGAWGLVLERYSGERDVVFGVTVSGRPPRLRGIDSMVGLFINTLPVRIDVAGERGLIPWLQQLQEQVLEHQSFEHTPLAKVQAWSDVPPGETLFDSILIFENYPIDASLRSAGRDLEVVAARSVEWTHYPLSLTVLPGEAFELQIVYDRRRSDPTAIRRLLGHLERLLSGMVDDPTRCLDALPLLSVAEERQVVLEWNDTRVARRPDACIHQRFEAWVERRPERPAVIEQRADGTLVTWSYRELEGHANRLAHYLRSLGAGPEGLVGLCLERNREMVAAHLAVLKVGAAYVPLDPTYPSERLAFMLEDGGVEILVTEQRLLDVLPEHRARLVLLDADAEEIARERPERPAGEVVPDNLSHVIYTSGSTGKPKAVMIPHRSLARFTDTMIHEYDLREGDRILQFGSISFDAATEELYTSFTVGGTLVLRTEEMLTSTAYFLARCDELAISVLDLPTAFWHQVCVDLDTASLSLPSALRTVVIAGERAMPERLATWLRHAAPDVRLINAYGPSEGTIVATTHIPREHIHQAADAGWREIPIGRPILNVEVHILNRRLRPVAAGIAGELHIGGAGVTRGYLGRPNLTAAKFVPDPFRGTPGGRLYQTGDLTRHLPDGRIEFMGRVDHQVKLRGFRVELGEIEATLEQHPEVRQAALKMWDEPGIRRLVAYVVPKRHSGGSPEDAPPAQPSTSELRDFLNSKLPAYMVPAAFVRLAELPLTASGSKVDRRALPEPDFGRPELGGSHVDPRTPVEGRLVAIWSAVLGVEEIGVEDNFFALGGDSILGIQVTARAHQEGLRFTPRQLFEHPTIVALAGVVATAAAPEAEQGPVVGEVPLTPIQHWFFEQDLPQRDHWNQAILLTVREVTPAVLEQAVGALVEHHDALRLRCVAGEEGWRQHVASIEATAAGSVFTHFDLSGLSADQRREALAARATEAQTSLRLAEGPLLRAVSFDFGAEARLLLAVHHLAVDGVSWRLLVEDLTTGCRQAQAGEPIVLPPKTTSFQRWAKTLVEVAGSSELEREAAYWTAVVAAEGGAQHPAPRALPLDFPEHRDDALANVEAATRKVEVTLTREETQALLQEVPEAYNTRINDALLSALARSLSRFVGAESVLVDLEGHGREQLSDELDVSRTVGWFTSAFPVRLRTGSGGVEETLKSIKEQLRAVPRNGIGYGLSRYLRDDVHAERLRRGPAVEVGFNYLGQLDQALDEASPFALAAEPHGSNRDGQSARSYLLEIDGSVFRGCLELVFLYSKHLHREATVVRLAESCLSELRALIAHCQSLSEGGFTPSDFPQMEFDQGELDDLMADLAEGVE